MKMEMNRGRTVARIGSHRFFCVKKVNFSLKEIQKSFFFYKKVINGARIG